MYSATGRRARDGKLTKRHAGPTECGTDQPSGLDMDYGDTNIAAGGRASGNRAGAPEVAVAVAASAAILGSALEVRVGGLDASALAAGLALGIALAGLLPVLVKERPPWHHPKAARPLLCAGIALLALSGGAASAGRTPSTLVTGLVGAAAYPFIALGLLRFACRPSARRELDTLMEAGLGAAAAGLGLWVALARPGGGFGRGAAAPAALTIVLCALDAGAMTLAVRLNGRRDAGRFERLVLVGAGALLAQHALSAFGRVGSLPVGITSVRFFGVVALGCLATALVTPETQSEGDQDAIEVQAFRQGHVVYLALCMLVAPGVIALQAQRHTVVSAATAVGAAVLELLMTAYVTTLLWDRAESEHRAQHDHLTGLPNSLLFRDRVQRAVAHARRSESLVAVMFLDLDRFKHVNDSLGHSAGDDVLREVAARLRRELRDEDTVARLGGDEFAILLPDLSQFDGAVVVAEKVLKAFRPAFVLGGETWVLTPSIGIAVYPTDGRTADQLIANADTAMYRVKDAGRNGFEVFTPSLHAKAQERVMLEAALHNALEREELVVHYQAKVDVRTGMIVGAEALVRWQHPERGLLFPGDFIGLAEQTGQVVAIGEAVMHEACRQNRAWQEAGLPAIPVAVNVSVPQFKAGIAEVTASVLRRTGLAAPFLEVEITESAAAEGLDVITEVLQELRSFGVRCSIDDFGTGYCGLSYLSRLPIDALKIDKSFIDLMSNGPDAAIVAAVISMGHSLGLKVIAEGVETEEQRLLLAEFDCDQIQGYLFAKPMPASEFEVLLAGRGGGSTSGSPPARPPAAAAPAVPRMRPVVV
ncbi:MAG: diguanylate cyclase/phosphodiesterase with sensor(s) [Acidimicrobiales bacterium]|nr:diguanylate cyclase/phosphodiesterase with sensor(s) [Acidimicrobiales bacterium]